MEQNLLGTENKQADKKYHFHWWQTSVTKLQWLTVFNPVDFSAGNK